jgi:hypothetical protein
LFFLFQPLGFLRLLCFALLPYLNKLWEISPSLLSFVCHCWIHFLFLFVLSLLFSAFPPFSNLVTALFKHERIETTVTRAKELRRWADWMIKLAKRGRDRAFPFVLSSSINPDSRVPLGTNNEKRRAHGSLFFSSLDSQLPRFSKLAVIL